MMTWAERQERWVHNAGFAKNEAWAFWVLVALIAGWHGLFILIGVALDRWVI